METLGYSLLDDRRRSAIEIAAAQWVRSESAVAAAYEHMLQIGIDRDEIEANRRATSADSRIAPLLRYAVTLLITKGRVNKSDLALVRREHSDAVLAEVAAITARAFLRIALLESLHIDVRAPRIDVEIGDY